MLKNTEIQKGPSIPVSQACHVLIFHLFIFDNIFDSLAS